VTHEVAVIHGDVATTTPSGDPEDGTQHRQQPGLSKPSGGFGRNSREGDDMKIGVSEQRLVLGEGSTARRNPWLRLSLGIVGSVGAISCVFPANVYGRVSDLSPTISVRVYNYNYVKASPPMLARVEREAGRILGEARLADGLARLPDGAFRRCAC
jgi:hypothetical protein